MLSPQELVTNVMSKIDPHQEIEQVFTQ